MEKLYSGVRVVSNFQYIDEFYKKGSLPLSKFNLEEVYPNMLLVVKGGKHTILGIVKGNAVKKISFDQEIHNLKSRNKEQDFVISLLKDPEIECVTIAGPAGSGKTLLALAFAMEELKSGKISKVVLCKNFTPLGREIGFLKGDMDAKVRPWMGSFFDNFEVLGIPYYELDNLTNPASEQRKLSPGHIEISPITFVQGRSISNAVIIVDEAQNLSREVIKQILTRPAEGSKIILLGDPEQIIEKGVQDKNNGLVAAVEAGKDAKFVGHITLIKSERSKLAEWYSKKL